MVVKKTGSLNENTRKVFWYSHSRMLFEVLKKKLNLFLATLLNELKKGLKLGQNEIAQDIYSKKLHSSSLFTITIDIL